MLTKLRQYSGPGYNLALEVSDAAHGGQVLLTENAWQKLSTNMAAANFPTVAQIGLYKFDHWQANIWIYEVRWSTQSLAHDDAPVQSSPIEISGKASRICSMI